MSRNETVEDIRVKLGLSRPQLERVLIGYEDDELSRMRQIAKEYSAYCARLRQSIRALRPEPVDGMDCLSVRQVSEVLKLGEFHVSNLRARGKLEAVYKEGYGTLFPVETVINLVGRPLARREHYSPLAPQFISWLNERGLLVNEDAAVSA